MKPSFFITAPGKDVAVYLVHRNSKLYTARWNWHDELKWTSTGTSNLAHAKSVAIAKIEKIILEESSIPEGELKNIIEEYLKTKWPEQKKSDRGFSEASSRLKMFLAQAPLLWEKEVNLSAMTLEETVDLIQRFLDNRRDDKNDAGEPISALTLRNDRMSISAFFTWIIQRRTRYGIKYLTNPASKNLLMTPQVTFTRKSPLSESTIQDLLRITKKKSIYPAIVLCLGAGLRPKGACSVVWKNVDLEHRRIRVTEKKRERVIPLSTWAADELRPLKGNPDESVVGMAASTVFRDLAAIVEYTEDNSGKKILEGVTLQTLRVTADVMLYRAGVDPQKAAKIMGHSVTTAMKHYVDYEGMDAHKDVEALNFAPKKKKISKKEKAS